MYNDVRNEKKVNSYVKPSEGYSFVCEGTKKNIDVSSCNTLTNNIKIGPGKLSEQNTRIGVTAVLMGRVCSKVDTRENKILSNDLHFYIPISDTHDH